MTKWENLQAWKLDAIIVVEFMDDDGNQVQIQVDKDTLQRCVCVNRIAVVNDFDKPPQPIAEKRLNIY